MPYKGTTSHPHTQLYIIIMHILCLQEGPAPPAPPPMDVRRRKRDLSNHRISKRHVNQGQTRRQKRQAEGQETMTAHQMMEVIEKVSQ